VESFHERSSSLHRCDKAETNQYNAKRAPWWGEQDRLTAEGTEETGHAYPRRVRRPQYETASRATAAKA
jgi:hypothetical protein